MALAVAPPHMERESTAFGLLTAIVIGGSFVLVAGVGAFEHTRTGVVAAGGAVMVVGILAMAGYISMLPEPEGHEAESGH